MVLMQPSIKLHPENEQSRSPCRKSTSGGWVDGQRRETKEGEGGKPLKYLKLVKIQKKVNTCILKN